MLSKILKSMSVFSLVIKFLLYDYFGDISESLCSISHQIWWVFRMSIYFYSCFSGQVFRPLECLKEKTSYGNTLNVHVI